MTICRCGWDGTSEHRCHRCGKEPGQRRLYVPSFKVSLAGEKEKRSVTETWGCDNCWSSFQKLLAENPNR